MAVSTCGFGAAILNFGSRPMSIVSTVISQSGTAENSEVEIEIAARHPLPFKSYFPFPALWSPF